MTLPVTNGTSESHSRPIATRTITPGIEHEMRTYDLLNLPHGKVKKICCIGAGYVVRHLPCHDFKR
ncbi:MAG: hypothetical protein INR71_01065 [Terriglobus roseus]|nr:hypothetical protein [Terriglobus roseus]